jgi:hypothetical protein|tara:strand:- start:104 stop:610 length:507 start_codon:yes stop_codon:yes gene_type:complete
VILGVGHSGTTIVVRMLHAMGWKQADSNSNYREMHRACKVNCKYLTSGVFDEAEARVSVNYEDGWVMKDPRLVITLPLWRDILVEKRVLLLHIERQIEDVKQSYIDRSLVNRDGEPALYGKTVDELTLLGRQRYEEWEGDKLSLHYDQIAVAASLFDPQAHGHPIQRN